MTQPTNKKPASAQSSLNQSGLNKGGAKPAGASQSASVSHAASQAAKTASAAAGTASKLAQNAYNTAESTRRQAQSSVYNAAESTRKAAQNVVNIGGDAMRDALTSSMRDMRDTHEKVHEMGREGVENLARGADMATRLVVELVNLARGNVDAYIECSTVAAGAAKNIGAEMVESCNNAFSECVDLSKEAFNCRTINDVMDLHNRVFRQTIERFFNDSGRLCNLAFECCTEAMEPINERMADASDQFCKALAA